MKKMRRKMTAQALQVIKTIKIKQILIFGKYKVVKIRHINSEPMHNDIFSFNKAIIIMLDAVVIMIKNDQKII